jgi:hypothetical protein
LSIKGVGNVCWPQALERQRPRLGHPHRVELCARANVRDCHLLPPMPHGIEGVRRNALYDGIHCFSSSVFVVQSRTTESDLGVEEA